MRPIDFRGDSYAEYNENLNKKNPEFKAGDHVRFQNIKTSLLKDILQSGQRKFLLSAKLKIQFLGHT